MSWRNHPAFGAQAPLDSAWGAIPGDEKGCDRSKAIAEGLITMFKNDKRHAAVWLVKRMAEWSAAIDDGEGGAWVKANRDPVLNAFAELGYEWASMTGPTLREAVVRRMGQENVDVKGGGFL